MATINRPRAAWFLPDGNSRSVVPEAGKPSELPGTPEMSRKSGLRSSSGTARGRAPQKSEVVLSCGSASPSMRYGQSAAVMSQNRHSCAFGTRLAGFLAASRRIKDPRSLMNWGVQAAPGNL